MSGDGRRALWRAALRVAFLALMTGRCAAQDTAQFWPEIDTYVNLNSHTRLFFISAASVDPGSGEVEGEFGPNFDFYIRPFLRPRLRDMDPAKSKLLTFRIGYRYLPVIEGNGPNENRPIAELTGRFKLPLAVLLSDRSRFDFRFVSGQPFSWRYRNRVTLERNFEIRKYTFTPYLRGEFFYDSREGKIDKTAFSVGSTFPLTKRTELEVYYEDRRDSSSTPNTDTRAAGVALGLYF
jgi:hypothetical protein